MRKNLLFLYTLGALSLTACSETSTVEPTPTQGATPSVGSAERTQTLLAVARATANLHPIRRSGISAFTTFRDDGITLAVNGMAFGMDPLKAYASLLYDQGSVARGPQACLPSDNSLTFNQMVLGYWLPLGSRTRRLVVVKTGNLGVITDYAPLNLVGTVSIREDTQFPAPLPSVPDPNRFQIRACGKVKPLG